MRRALVIGNSDGIGLAVTRALLRQDYAVIGISRRASPVAHDRYQHVVQDVTEPAYRDLLADIVARHPDLDVCIYCAGIGGRFDLEDLGRDVRVFQVNLMAAVVTTELVLGHMVRRDAGHFIGLSSIADVLTSAEAPSYCASKAALSHYWEGLGLALASRKVKLTNVRFGFVDTKMARAPVRPFMMSAERAAAVILDAIARPRIRITRPLGTAVLARILALTTRIKLAMS
jgi:NAD(P)-dependent dehydrogenase (short-subunit alcohol dehydrogenase family)